MSARAVIDSLEFARSGGEMLGEVPLAELGRLAECLSDRSGTLQYTLTGCVDERQRPQLRLRVNGAISLVCQRCLGSLLFAVGTDSSLLLLDAANAGAQADVEDLDAVTADAALDVWSLVEDEVLLALPMAPRHPEGACGAGAGGGRERAASPFAVLAGLKHRQVN